MMDKYLNTDELRWQELVEHKDFEALTDEERIFVLSKWSEEEYRWQRSILSEAPHIYSEEAQQLAAPPFIVQETVATSFWFKKLPAYQTILAVAATVLIMWYLRLPQENFVSTIEDPEVSSITQVDTVFETQYVTDTFYQYIDKPVVVEKIKYITQIVDNSSTLPSQPVSSEESRMLNPGGGYVLPLEDKSLAASNSYKNDDTKSLLISVTADR